MITSRILYVDKICGYRNDKLWEQICERSPFLKQVDHSKLNLVQWIILFGSAFILNEIIHEKYDSNQRLNLMNAFIGDHHSSLEMEYNVILPVRQEVEPSN